MRKPKLLPVIMIASVLSTGAIVHSQAPAVAAPAPVDSLLLSLIQAVGSTDEDEEPELSLGALDFLSSVYEEADYYTTGLCDESLRPKKTEHKSLC